MSSRESIIEFLDAEFLASPISDSGLNGLQFEGSAQISRVALAVDSGLSVIRAAIEKKSDLLLVHHGLFWDKVFPITGVTREIFSALLTHNLNLYAVHLPLDAHIEWGNNFVLARYLGLEELRSAIAYRGTKIGCIGENRQHKGLEVLREELRKLPGGELTSTVLPFGPAIPERVCVVTGSGADALQCAAAEGFDTLITGEPRQFAYHYAKDHGLNVIFAGHYASETVGVRAVGNALKERFQVETFFIDAPTGI